MTIRTEVGERVKARRELKGWTQDELAVLIHHTRIAVALWESGRNSIPMEYLPRLAEVLGVSTDWLLGKAAAEFTAEECDVVNDYRDTPDEYKPFLRRIIHAGKIPGNHGRLASSVAEDLAPYDPGQTNH